MNDMAFFECTEYATERNASERNGTVSRAEAYTKPHVVLSFDQLGILIVLL